MKDVGYEKGIAMLITFLRNKVSDPSSRGSDDSKNFSGTGSQTEFSLTKKHLTNVYFVKVDSVEVFEHIDFNVVHDDPTDTSSFPKIVFEVAPANGTSIDVSFHYRDTWVYQSYPVEEFISPTISLSHISSREEFHALGLYETSTTKSTKIVTWLQIDVWTRKGDIYTIGGVKYSGNKLKDMIADKITNSIAQNRSLLKKQGIEDIVLRMARDLDYESSTGLYRKTMDWEFVSTVEWAA